MVGQLSHHAIICSRWLKGQRRGLLLGHRIGTPHRGVAPGGRRASRRTASGRHGGPAAPRQARLPSTIPAVTDAAAGLDQLDVVVAERPEERLGSAMSINSRQSGWVPPRQTVTLRLP
jgi:hypothetical protein